MIDPWRMLGLAPGSSTADIKRAYRRLAKEHHPDSAGQAALPRFLAIQQAYETLMSPRAPRVPGRARPTPSPGGRTAGGGTSSSGGPAWEADPARARATPGAQRPGGGTRRRGEGTSGSRGESGPRAPGEGGSARRPRRPSRRATFGSTTYGDAHDPATGEWSGAAWYGPSSGEYWTVNPREYADPRKHGPEYQARGRAPGESEPRETDPRGWSTTAHGAARRATADRRAGGGPTARATADARSDAPSSGRGASLPAPSFTLPTGATTPQRVALVLLAWGPIGLGAASIIGAITGCARFEATCDPGEDLLPWVAQVVILVALAILVAADRAAVRAMAGGTVAVLLAALPTSFLLAASGASRDPIRGGIVLGAVLAIAWLGGVVLTALGRARRSRAEPAHTIHR